MVICRGWRGRWRGKGKMTLRVSLICFSQLRSKTDRFSKAASVSVQMMAEYKHEKAIFSA